MSFLAEGRSAGNVDVPTMFDASVSEAIAAIVGLGVLVSIGTTSDGGALMLQLTLDGEWRREYFREHLELLEYLQEAEKALAQEAPRSSPAPKARKRRSAAR